MKKAKYFIVIFLLAGLVSCSSSKEMAYLKGEMEQIRSEEVADAIRSQRFIVKVDRTLPRRGGILDLREDHNYIVVNGNMARMSLAYVGRSDDIRGISGINMTGEIIERDISQKKRGNMQINLRMKQNNDTFNVYIIVGKTGSCRITVHHARIDQISYEGRLMAMK